MPFVVACPACRRKLQAPDDLRDEVVRCPACATAFSLAPSTETTTAAVIAATGVGGITLELASQPLPGVLAGQAKPEVALTERFAWGRIYGGMGWITAGLAIGFGAIFLQYLPLLLRLSGVELVPYTDEEIWGAAPNTSRLFRRSVGLMVFGCCVCLSTGSLQLWLYPGRGRGSVLAMVSFSVFLCWELGWLGIGLFLMLNPDSPTSHFDEQQRIDFLNVIGFLAGIAFVIFLRELGRDCVDQAVLSRSHCLLVMAAGFVVGLVAIRAGTFRELWMFLGLLALQAQMLRLVLAAREAAGRWAS